MKRSLSVASEKTVEGGANATREVKKALLQTNDTLLHTTHHQEEADDRGDEARGRSDENDDGGKRAASMKRGDTF